MSRSRATEYVWPLALLAFALAVLWAAHYSPDSVRLRTALRQMRQQWVVYEWRE